MENIFQIDDEGAVESFKKQNPTKDDYYDIVGVHDPEFLIKEYQSRRSTWDIESTTLNQPSKTSNIDEFEKEVKRLRASYKADQVKFEQRFNVQIPEGYHEIQLYDNCKGFKENFEHGEDVKYILFEVRKDKEHCIGDPEFILPSPQSKCLIDIEKVEDYNSLEFIPIDYDSFFGLRLSSFKKYNNDFFLCDERVIFEALLMKYKYFDFNPFYWSKEKIYEETGIKKDRSTKILDKFCQLKILSKELKKSMVQNRPMQINYYDLNPEEIIKLIPEIYVERDGINIEKQMLNYLKPALFRRSSSLMQ